MAQVGRISGPLLYANLERLGQTAGADQNLTFSDTAISSGGTPLLFVDVINSRIGVNNNIPQYELDVTGTTRISTTLDVDTQANFTNLNFTSSSIQAFPGSITLDSQTVITANNIQTDNLNIDFNRIQAITPNTNIELRPNGTGSVEVFADTNVYGNIDATGSITLAGNINFGDSDTDNVTFNTDVASDIIPNLDGVYTLGNSAKRWQDIESVLMNGVEINTQVATVAGVDVNLAPGKTWFVAQNGNNSNAGDRQQGAWRTIDYAVTQASAGDTIYVYPGEYEESCPIEVPAGVSIVGHDQRNTIIYPASSQSTNDIFLLNGETLVQNFTIKDFYYDSVNDIGYAFRFAPGGKVTSRSPYIQNTTVITKGSVITSADPKGFDQGDAGKGILVDGAVLASDTREASMLFHAVTLITPGVDAVTMTNGVRVEWLNSFTYFANRGLYATQGTGRVTDNLITRYGAEIRSIGSANVYGNIGAEADGADTLMYLVNHNWGYIGTGKDGSNDNTLAIQANETIELNNGKIHFQSQAQDGDFRVGDNFLIDFAKGSQTFDINDVPVVGVEQITVTTGSDVTFLDLDYIQTGNIRFIDNTVASITGDLNLSAASGITNFTANVVADQNLYASGNLTIGGGLIAFGNNQAIDTVTFDSGIDSDLLPKTTDIHDIGSTSKQWRDVYLTDIYLDSLNIADNYIETMESNASLELRANGTGQIVFEDSVTIDNNLDIGLEATFNGIFDITGSISVSNLATVIGTLETQSNMSVTDYLNVDGGIQSENILLDDNFITTTITNSNLELRASGTGLVSLIPNVRILQDLDVTGNVEATDVNTIILTQSNSLTVNDILIQNNLIQSGSDLNLVSTGDVVFVKDVDITNTLTVTGLTTLSSISTPAQKTITGLITHTGNKTTTGSTTQTGNFVLDGDMSITSDAQFEDISIAGNVVSTTLSNSDLELRAAGTGSVLVNENLVIQNNTSVSGITTLVDLNSSTKIESVRFDIADVNIDGNVITSSTGDLNLRSSGTGRITVPVNDVLLENALDVIGLSFFSNGTNLTGTLTHVGNKVHNGNINLVGTQNISNVLTTDRLVSFENIDIEDNFITTSSGNLDLDLRASGTGNVIFPSNNVIVNNNLTIGLFTINDNLQLTDASADRYTNSSILISDNTIETTESNSNLELRANGSGEVYIPSNSVEFSNDLTVNGTTNLSATDVTGTITHNGNKVQVGNTTLTGNVTVTGLLDVPNMDFENILIDTNVITTVESNSDLELRATGIVHIQETLNVPNTANITTVESDNINNTALLSTNELKAVDSFVNKQISIDDNNIIFDTLQLQMSAAADIRFTNLKVNDQLNVSAPGISTFSDTEVNGNITVILDRTQTGNLTQTGDLTLNGDLNSDRQVQFENILIDDNFITTTISNSDLELLAQGNVVIPSNNLSITNNLSVDTIDSVTINNTGIVDSNILQTTGSNILFTGSTISSSSQNITLDSGNGLTVFDDNVTANKNLSVGGISNFANTDINGTLTIIGNTNQTGNNNITGLYTVGTSATFDRAAVLGDLKFEGNKISSRGVNQNIVIQSPGVGTVGSVFSSVEFGQDLTVLGTINSNNIVNATNVNAEEFNTGQLKIFDNNIDSIGANTNIVLKATTGSNIFVDTNDVNITNNLNANDAFLQQVFLNGDLTHNGFRIQNSPIMQILGNNNLTITGSLIGQSFAQFEDIVIGTVGSSTIRTSLSNSDLEFVALNDVVFSATDVRVTSADTTVGQTLFSKSIQNSFTINTAELSTGDIKVSSDTIQTTASNSNLEINNDLQLLDNVSVSQDLTVNGLYDATDVIVNGTITHTGNRTVTNVDIIGDLTVDGDAIISGEATFEGVVIGGNYVSTYESNADLELRAAGTGEIDFTTDTAIAKNLAVNGVTDIRELTVQNVTSAERFDNGDVVISDNTIQTTLTNSNLDIRASAAGSVDVEDINIDQNTVSSISDINFVVNGNIDIHGTNAVKLPAGTTAQKTVNTQGDIRFNTQTGLFEGFTTVPVAFSGIYSADRLTSVDATKTSNQILFTQQGVQTASIQPDNFFISGIILPQMYINNNTIGVSQTDTDLTFENGTGVFNIEDITIEDSKIINNTNNALEIKNNQVGYYTVLASNTGVLLPAGPSANRSFVEVGDTRWNTEDQLLETYDGNTYIASAGLSNNITPQEFDDLLFEYTLIFG